MENKSFILHSDSYETIKKLPDSDRLQLYDTIFKFQKGEDIGQLSFTVELVFDPIKRQFERDKEKWSNTIIKRRSAGKLGGIKSGEIRGKQDEANEANASKTKQTKQDEANEAVSITVSDTVNVNVTVIKDYYNISKDIPIEERTVTQHLIVCFYNLGYSPAKDETVDSLKEWISGIAKVKLKSASQMIDIINSWHAYWKGNKKAVKNHKASLLNHYDLKNDK